MHHTETPLTTAEPAQVRLLVATTAAFALGALALSAAGQTDAPTGSIVLQKIGGTPPGAFDASAAEIAAHDPATQRLFVTNAGAGTVDVLDISDPTQPAPLFSIDVTPFGHHANSVAVRAGLVAVAVEAEPKTDPGAVVFFDAQGTLRGGVPVDSQPDMLAFTPNGRFVLVANEGEPASDYSVDPAGSVSIIPLAGGVGGLTADDVVRAGFEAFDADPGLIPAGVRLSGPSPLPSQDIEPEYIAIAGNSRTAYVTLQENNAIAVVDILAGKVAALLPLGTKDHSLPGAGLDPSDKDNAVAIANWPLQGLYMPDGIAFFRAQGGNYLITANEGDTRDWDAFSDEARVSTLTLDPTAFPNAASLKTSAQLGRLVVSTVDGDTDGDGDHDVLHPFGARSVSIWTEAGDLAWDGGDQLEALIAEVLPAEFNSDHTKNGSFDNRSDNKGPEPEGVTVAKLFGRTLAFVGLERIGGIVALDVTNPAAPELAAYVNSRDFAGDPAAGTAGDLGPEGLLVIPAARSPIGTPLLVAAFEVSGSVGIFSIAPGN
jgi:DNA-binding beta-propeller fold protein YncE